MSEKEIKEEESEVKQISKTKAWFSARKSRILLTVLISLALPLIIFISVPLDIYAHNQAEFMFALSDFIPGLIVAFLLLAIVMAAILFTIPTKIYRTVAYVFIAIEFLCFFQGTYLNAGLSSLTGDNNGWTGGGWNDAKTIFFVVLNAIIWVGVIGLMVFLSLRPDKKGIFRIISLVMVVIVLATQLMNCFVQSISNKDLYLSYSEMEEKSGKFHSLTSKDINDVSDSNNIYYFIVDRFDESFAEKAYDADNEFFDELTGFTWFKDHLAYYAHTYPAIACMLSDKMYDTEVMREDFLNEVYKGDTPLKELSGLGYSINLYTQPYYAYNYNGDSFPEYINNFTEGSYKAERKVDLTISMARMSMYRCLPTALKATISQGMNSSTCNDCVSFYGDDGSPSYAAGNDSLWNLVKDEAFTVKSGKQFSFVHMEGCHDLNEKSKTKKVLKSLTSSFNNINAFLQVLKERGLYENATIIITGDHGLSHNDSGNISEPVQTALFVKPRGAGSEKLKTSDAQTSHGDIWPTIMKSEGINSEYAKKDGVFDIQEGENRVRYHYHQTWKRGNFDEYTYKIEGSSKKWSNWKQEGHKHYDRHLMD